MRIKETLGTSFLLDERVRFTVQGGTVGGFFLLTDDRMIFLSLERGEHRLELTRGEVCSIIPEEHMTVRIYLNNTQFIRIISGVSEEICDVLQQNGWTVSNQK